MIRNQQVLSSSLSAGSICINELGDQYFEQGSSGSRRARIEKNRSILFQGEYRRFVAFISVCTTQSIARLVHTPAMDGLSLRQTLSLTAHNPLPHSRLRNDRFLTALLGSHHPGSRTSEAVHLRLCAFTGCDQKPQAGSEHGNSDNHDPGEAGAARR